MNPSTSAFAIAVCICVSTLVLRDKISIPEDAAHTVITAGATFLVGWFMRQPGFIKPKGTEDPK